MAKYLSLPYSDDTSLLFPHYDYKYCRKCTGYVWILSKSDNVQMFVSILSSLTVLFHKPLGFVCKTLTHLGNTCMVSPQKVDTSYFDNSVPMHKNHMHLSPQLDLAKGNRWANNVQEELKFIQISPHLLYQNTFYHVSDFLAMEGRGAHCGGLVLVH